MRIDLILESKDPPGTIAELGRLAEDNGLGGIWAGGKLSDEPWQIIDPFLLDLLVVRAGPLQALTIGC